MARVMKKTHVKNAKKQQQFKQKALQNKDVLPTVVREHRKINSWQEDRMLWAIEEFRRGGIGLCVIARAWGVPKSTLERRVKGKVVGHEHLLGKKTLVES